MTDTQLQTITIQEPRSVTRIAFAHAIRISVTEQERAEYSSALTWYEMKWRAQDAQTKQAAQMQSSPRETREASAVEEHEIDSP